MEPRLPGLGKATDQSLLDRRRASEPQKQGLDLAEQQRKVCSAPGAGEPPEGVLLPEGCQAARGSPLEERLAALESPLGETPPEQCLAGLESPLAGRSLEALPEALESPLAGMSREGPLAGRESRLAAQEALPRCPWLQLSGVGRRLAEPLKARGPQTAIEPWGPEPPVAVGPYLAASPQAPGCRPLALPAAPQ
jgi:hypothetical protein